MRKCVTYFFLNDFYQNKEVREGGGGGGWIEKGERERNGERKVEMNTERV
jgi:hypothetical protein